MTSIPLGLLSLFCICQTPAPNAIPGTTFTNSIGIEFVCLQPGSFTMGESNPVIPEELGGPVPRGAGDGDERPLHQVTLTQPLWMARSEVTARQYQKFRPDHQNEGRYAPYASGMSWNEAEAFCLWLSDREEIPYRLPTEAEWEYACRAGSTGLFASGEVPPEHEAANPWGLRNLQTGVAEYCLDWHGDYPAFPQVDPVGPEWGWTRVVRGGGIQEHGLHSEVGGWQPYYRRSANRAGVPLNYRGQHSIGIRLVQAPMPKSAPHPAEAVFAQQCVKGNLPPGAVAPDGKIPHFKVRPLLPIPPDNMEPAAIAASGLAPELQGHNHSPGIAACGNGDLLAVFFSATGSHAAEYWPNVGLILSRLRYGALDWDFPCPFLDVPDVNEGTAVIWNDGGILHAFAGGVGMSDIPFKWSNSKDNGATWDGIQLPLLRGLSGGYYPQPITPGFRDNQGTLYLPSDGLDATTLLWVSHDEGVTWSDPGGRTGGRHTAFALLRDGGILGMGGKNSNVDGYMPKSISHDGGKSYNVSKTPFAPLATNQRPSLVRLASGRLFFAGDFQNFDGKQPAGIHEHGCYAALSEDEGETWIIRKLPGTLPHESKTLVLPKIWASNRHQEGTLGYSAACRLPTEHPLWASCRATGILQGFARVPLD
jgi:formylglycine-generating enzyme required for sulfatase activity